MDRQKVLLLGAAVCLRLALFLVFPALPTVLTNRVEVSTPVTSFKRCKYLHRGHDRDATIADIRIVQEGVFLYSHNINPYDGGVFHQAPLFLTLFSVLDPFAYPLAVDLVYILCDLFGAIALMRIAETGEAYASRLYKSPRSERYSSTAIAARLVGYLNADCRY